VNGTFTRVEHFPKVEASEIGEFQKLTSDTSD